MKNSLLLAATLAITLSGSASAQEPLRALAEDAFAKPATTWFDPKACKQPSSPDLYLSVGKAVLKVPVAIVRGGSPGKLDRMTQDVNKKITLHVPQNVGCAERPWSISNVQLAPVRAVESGAIVISWTPEGRSLDPQLTQLRDSGSCPVLEPGLLYCDGSRNVGGAREQVVYLMAADSTLVQRSGGPLRARCLFRDNKPFCNVLDDLDGDVRYELPIVGKPSLDTITQAHAKARAYVDSLRVKAR